MIVEHFGLNLIHTHPLIYPYLLRWALPAARSELVRAGGAPEEGTAPPGKEEGSCDGTRCLRKMRCFL